MKTCVYCGEEKPDKAFSDEHIWPEALGGGYLPADVWRTREVCKPCNSNMAGLHADGSFNRSLMGLAERSNGSLQYLAGKSKPAAIPLDYLGQLQDIPVRQGVVAEYWVGPCGASIIHIRPDDAEERWTTYTGGDPRARKSKAGRAYMALTADDEFWILVSFLSFKCHFKHAERFIVNAEFPPNWPFRNPDRSDPDQAADMETVDAVISQIRAGKRLHARSAISFDLGNRMLAKLGLSVGYKLLGAEFVKTDYAKNLRKLMREAKVEKRELIPVRGSGYFGEHGLGGAETVLSWPGGCDVSPNFHPATGRVPVTYEPMRLGGATGRGAEPSM